MIDFAELTDDGVDGNVAVLRAAGRRRQTRARAASVVVFLSALALVVWLQAGIARSATAVSANQHAYGILLLVGCGVAAVTFVIALVVVLTRAESSRRQTIVGSEHLRKFASVNGLNYEVTAESPGLPGRIFVGRHRGGLIVTDRISDPAGRFQIANYGFERPGGRAHAQGGVGYLAVRLDRKLPHLFLDGRPSREKSASPFAAGIAGEQEISLEGDFPGTFTLYAPLDYGADARYLLTPDLMALLVDEAADYTVEIVDDWMFVYSWYPFTDDVEAFRRVFSIIDLVGAKALRQSDRYRDDRSLTSTEVHQSGRRLVGGARSAAVDRWRVALVVTIVALIGATAFCAGLVH